MEQRALIAGVFSRIVAGPEVVTFHVHGQPFPIQAEWSAVVKVAGPRFVLITDGIAEFAGV